MMELCLPPLGPEPEETSTVVLSLPLIPQRAHLLQVVQIQDRLYPWVPLPSLAFDLQYQLTLTDSTVCVG